MGDSKKFEGYNIISVYLGTKEKMSVRQRVLSAFKSLHRVASQTFGGDERTLLAARIKINEEFKKNKHIQNEGSVDELVKLAEEVEQELKSNVIQAKEKEPGVYEAKITKDTTKLNNVMFDENAVIEKPRPGTKRCK
ncbi:Complex III assembly factor LYRM7 [Pseudolycoriella hygida]|uniref:Complex III assembly factor LYRM7 n=1 Tax=Pseudolycoriella hygida TaxID=35572 RepID=A0A9Q0N025_9DIPT|nr:Complex III assembly factor LYRM7 [Pseudolycoriella hygida]